jgi:hypothetical protein
LLEKYLGSKAVNDFKKRTQIAYKLMNNFEEFKKGAKLFQEGKFEVPKELIDLFIKCGKIYYL